MHQKRFDAFPAAAEKRDRSPGLSGAVWPFGGSVLTLWLLTDYFSIAILARSPDPSNPYQRRLTPEEAKRVRIQGFKQYAGHFWGFLETRPYMRARAGLAGTLLKLGDIDGAVGHYRDMLKLNPNDNQGIRYVLAA